PSFSSRCLSTPRTCACLPSGLCEAHAPPEPAISAVAFQPSRLVVGGSAGRSGSAQKRVGAGAFPHPPGKAPPGLTPATETRPVPVRRPGRWRLRATDAGTALTHGPARSATGRAPEGRRGIAPEAPWAGAARKHKIGTLSRCGRRDTRCGPPLPAVIAGPRRVSEILHRRRLWIAGSSAAPRNDGLLPGTAIRGRSKAAHPRPAPLQPPPPPADRPGSNRPSA
ncbi:hypothetical protein SAMN02799622_05758, partial [Methylobacterium sp. UNC378MF]